MSKVNEKEGSKKRTEKGTLDACIEVSFGVFQCDLGALGVLSL